MWTYNSTEELKHFGIKGMKWGVRRYQKKDGTLTPSGKLNNKQNNSEKKSKRREKLYKHYRELGMTEVEASNAVNKRIKTERMLIAISGVAAVSLAGYAIYSHRKNTIDQVIKSGKKLQNISLDKEKGVVDAFYSSMTEIDNHKYRGMYGSTLSVNGVNKVYETQIGVKKDLKVASKKNAYKIFKDMMEKDEKFQKGVTTNLWEMQGLGSEKANKTLLRETKRLNTIGKKATQGSYEAFNISLPLRTEGGLDTRKKFYDELKKKGYDAIEDLNDKKYSGYNSKKPLIIFNGSDKAYVDKIRELGKSEIEQSYKIGMNSLLKDEAIKTGAKYVSSLAASMAIGKTIITKVEDHQIKTYVKNNPDTNLTYEQLSKKFRN